MRQNVLKIIGCIVIFTNNGILYSNAQLKPPGSSNRPPVKVLLGPPAPANFMLKEQNTNSLKISWTDVSETEIGNRLIRSTDGINWITVAELGVIAKQTYYVYEDINLQLNKKYFYRLEVYGKPINGTKADNQTLTMRTPVIVAYTAAGLSIPVFRVQVKIKTSNLPDADLDGPLLVQVGHNWKEVMPHSAPTYLDAGHDDFERGDSYVYDLNFDGIKSLAQIGDIWISNTTTGDGQTIDSVCVIVNNILVYEKGFGTAGRRIPPYGTLILLFSEMANSSKWNQLINDQTGRSIPLGLQIVSYEGQFAIKIPKTEIESRIESIVGHTIYSIPVDESVAWYNGSRPVEIFFKDPNKISVDLDLYNLVFKNGSLDVDFNLVVSSTCEGNNQLKIKLESSGFSADLDYSWIGDVLSLGILKGFDKLYDWKVTQYGNNHTITKEMNFTIPECIQCANLKVKFSEGADLMIMLGSINNCF